MKTLYLVRHAKSSWDDTALDDFDRPLNDRGKKDAPLMGYILHQQHILPDLLLSSPAKRAHSTAKKIAKAVGYAKKDIQTNKNIYHAGPGQLLEIIQSLHSVEHSVMLVGHNPGLTDLSNLLCRKHIDNIPTCGVVCIEFDIEKWNQVMPESGRFIFFDYPKKHT
ncbi:histidine phosphatase family protein [Rhodocytophaga rosea]|uniref:Histidine phosphatase family protein n=1 Tax=Rhodocytophaga rosea TaxID=2704465 RepID=A0A6C0GFK4_9BACT|nr:histidine phosphatase family protein [Rhodocytophaga rosea]QHT66563.1 histidine phosphatase family protein [Rhodocytophaga rosea]